MRTKAGWNFYYYYYYFLFLSWENEIVGTEWKFFFIIIIFSCSFGRTR